MWIVSEDWLLTLSWPFHCRRVTPEPSLVFAVPHTSLCFYGPKSILEELGAQFHGFRWATRRKSTRNWISFTTICYSIDQGCTSSVDTLLIKVSRKGTHFLLLSTPKLDIKEKSPIRPSTLSFLQNITSQDSVSKLNRSHSLSALLCENTRVTLKILGHSYFLRILQRRFQSKNTIGLPYNH